MQGDILERRATERLEWDPSRLLSATVILEGNSLLDGGSFAAMEFPATPKDLSLGGIGLNFTFPVHFSAPNFSHCQLNLQRGPLKTDDLIQEVIVQARLAHFDPEGERMGLAFEGLNPEQRQFIEGLLLPSYSNYGET